ncbi:chemotaxis protein CheW [Gudongella oleilytica]|jgi:purine-binding chemotaxis protein CheW|uniref:chemotaxis protein CheW n=1 Tax=Gudongella oleilytica TaxID=1582259 RepID=UPI002A3718B7|nr:chemotaxis protein CheW [Gudongella oleilytica]MDY0256538.1 chemotaxis protein CheW [Gudongella oleilytica]HMM68955.1 chemotaxis protein CheW [Gudongella oleilytica]
MQIIVFKLSDKHFAIATEKIEEITKLLPSINVPKSPYGVEGLVNLRGNVVAQISLSKLLHLEEDLCYNNIMIVSNKDHKVGLLINEVLKVMDINESLIQNIEAQNTLGIKGIIQIDGAIVNILDVDELLSEKEGLS